MFLSSEKSFGYCCLSEAINYISHQTCFQRGTNHISRRDALYFLPLDRESLNRLDWKDNEPDSPNDQVLTIYTNTTSGRCTCQISIFNQKRGKMLSSDTKDQKVLLIDFRSAECLLFHSKSLTIEISSCYKSSMATFSCICFSNCKSFSMRMRYPIPAIFPDECIIRFLSNNLNLCNTPNYQ